MRILTFFLLLLLSTNTAIAEPPRSFNSSKKVTVSLWWDIGPSSFYCDCPYRSATAHEKLIRSGNLWVDGSVCGYKPKKALSDSGKPRATTMRIEWEHVVPADWIATGFNCQDLTRDDCRNINGFKEAEGDLFNLVPAVGELNNDRSARLFGEIKEEKREYGSCDFEVIKIGEGEPHTRGTAEPMQAIRGDIARIWFYMNNKYGVTLVNDEYEAMLEYWAVSDPVDEAELNRHDLIAAEMGWGNPYVAGQ